jgi:hypothetical protein
MRNSEYGDPDLISREYAVRSREKTFRPTENRAKEPQKSELQGSKKSEGEMVR